MVPAATQEPVPAKPTAPVTREKAMTAKRWEFSPSTVTVAKGQRVVLTITSSDVTHGFSLPDFGVTAKLVAGQETRVEFTPDKTGSFTFSCNEFCGTGHGSMRGTLIVQ